MRHKNTYTINGNEGIARALVEKYGPLSEDYCGRFITIYTDTDEFKQLEEECIKNNISLNLDFFEIDYTKAELESASYLKLRFNTYCSTFPEEYGTAYDYSCKCPCCGSGKTQVSDLYMDKTKMGKKDISIFYSFDVVVSERLHDILIENKVTGVDFINAHHKNNKMKNEPVLYQLIATNILPPLHEKTVLSKCKYCECCHKSGLGLKSLPYYDEKSLENAKDFNYTCEYFGAGLSGTPEIIVSQKVYRLFKQNKIRGGIFDIVHIV